MSRHQQDRRGCDSQDRWHLVPPAIVAGRPGVLVGRDVSRSSNPDVSARIRDALAQIRDLDALKVVLSPIFKEMRDGDTLWLCQSRYREPLHGHEGIALVRDKRPLVYIRVLNH